MDKPDDVYIKVREGEVSSTVAVEEGLLIDTDKDHQIVGIRIVRGKV